MIESIDILNFKSIDRINFPLGRVNVLIGENGAGKSNILEAIALSAAAAADKLDNEFLVSRGVRVSEPSLMRSAFVSGGLSEPVKVVVESNNSGGPATYNISNDNSPYSKWYCEFENDEKSPIDLKSFLDIITTDELTPDLRQDIVALLRAMASAVQGLDSASADDEKLDEDKGSKKRKNISATLKLKDNSPLPDFMRKQMPKLASISRELSQFVIFSPENTALRVFEREGQIQPLGINGEGLLKLLRIISENKKRKEFNEIRSSLKVFGWFRDFKILEDDLDSTGGIRIFDKFFDKKSEGFDQRSANEGFLFLLFYFTLFSSALAPRFFAVDNVDASLNPKLCERLIKSLVHLSKVHGKQCILTAHNPAVLDGLNLDDDEQRLFIVSRGTKGQTRISRIHKPASSQGQAPIRLSEAFLRGALGGLPKGF